MDANAQAWVDAMESFNRDEATCTPLTIDGAEGLICGVIRNETATAASVSIGAARFVDGKAVEFWTIGMRRA